MASNRQKTELMLGLFVLCGLLLLGFLIVYFGRFGDRFGENYKLQVQFVDGTGLLKGGDVRLGGARVGQISEKPFLNREFDGVNVLLQVRDDVKIPVGSTFTIATAGLLGDSYIQVDPPLDRGDPDNPQYYQGGDVVVGVSDSGLKALQDKVLRLSTSGVNTLAEVDQTVIEVKEMVKSLDVVIKKLDQGLLSDENLENFSVAMKDLRRTTKNFAETSDGLKPLFEESKVSLEKTLGSAETTFADASAAIKDLKPAIEKFADGLEEVTLVAENANKAVSLMTTGDGLLAALLTDGTLKSDMAAFIHNLKERGVLRYKDPETDAKKDSGKKTRNNRTGGFGKKSR